MFRFLLISAIVIGCTFKKNSPYRTALLGELGTKVLDPMVLENYNLSTLLSQICTRLVSVDESMKIYGDLAVTWSYNKSKNIYTFKLDSKRKFISGEMITVEDVIYSLERAKMVSGPKWPADIKEIKKVSQNEVSLILKNYNPRILYQLSTPSSCILRKEMPFLSINGYRVPNSSGAYSISRIEKNITLKANKNFPKDHIEKTIEVFFMTQKEAVSEFEKGHIDDLSFYFLSEDEMQKIPRKRVVTFDIYWSWVIMLNPESKVFSNLQNREGFINSLDKKNIIERWNSSLNTGSSIIPRGMKGFEEKNTHVKLKPWSDCKKVKGALLEGLPKDKDLKNSILMNFSKNCNVEIEVLAMNKWSEAFRNKTYDFYISGLDTNTTDPLGFYRYFVKGYRENVLGYDSKKINDKFHELYNLEEVQRTSADYKELYQILNSEHFVFVLGYPRVPFIYSDTVSRAHMNPLGMHLNNWWKIGRQ